MSQTKFDFPESASVNVEVPAKAEEATKAGTPSRSVLEKAGQQVLVFDALKTPPGDELFAEAGEK